jgi:hypothetical protein
VFSGPVFCQDSESIVKSFGFWPRKLLGALFGPRNGLFHNRVRSDDCCRTNALKEGPIVECYHCLALEIIIGPSLGPDGPIKGLLGAPQADSVLIDAETRKKRQTRLKFNQEHESVAIIAELTRVHTSEP